MILVHAGRSTDYHSEMDGRCFEKWFTDKLLPNIPTKSAIVMDNAPYHSAALEKAPTESTHKADTQLWLTKKSVPWSQDMVRAELLELAQEVNSPRSQRGVIRETPASVLPVEGVRILLYTQIARSIKQSQCLCQPWFLRLRRARRKKQIS